MFKASIKSIEKDKRIEQKIHQIDGRFYSALFTTIETVDHNIPDSLTKNMYIDILHFSETSHYKLDVKLNYILGEEYIDSNIVTLKTSCESTNHYKYTLVAKHKLFAKLDEIPIVSLILYDNSDDYKAFSYINKSNLTLYEDIMYELEDTTF